MEIARTDTRTVTIEQVAVTSHVCPDGKAFVTIELADEGRLLSPEDARRIAHRLLDAAQEAEDGARRRSGRCAHRFERQHLYQTAMYCIFCGAATEEAPP